MNFVVAIPNLAALQEAMANYASIATPIVQNAIVASQAILAGKFTNATTVPIQYWLSACPKLGL